MRHLSRNSADNCNVKIDHVQISKPNQKAHIERSDKSYREEVLDSQIFSKLSQVRELSWGVDWGDLCRALGYEFFVQIVDEVVHLLHTPNVLSNSPPDRCKKLSCKTGCQAKKRIFQLVRIYNFSEYPPD
jgi:hypothetical protein